MMTRDELLRNAMRLPLEDRVLLANQLLASLREDDDQSVRNEWAAEIDRRIAAYDRGEIEWFSETDVRRSAARRRSALPAN